MRIVPVVFETGDRGEQQFDVYSRLMKEGAVCLFGVITQETAADVWAQLMLLSRQNGDRKIEMFICSPGGEVDAGLMIYDAMQNIPNPIQTVCIGKAMSMAALLVAAGSAGHRLIYPNARMMIHQPSTSIGGQATDIEIAAREIQRNRGKLDEILSRHTGLPLEKVAAMTDRDSYMSAEEAKSLGLVDRIVGR